MNRRLTKTGNSHTLVITREMKEHLGLEEPQIDVQYIEGAIVLRKPSTFEDALSATFAQYDTALRNLAK